MAVEERKASRVQGTGVFERRWVKGEGIRSPCPAFSPRATVPEDSPLQGVGRKDYTAPSSTGQLPEGPGLLPGGCDPGFWALSPTPKLDGEDVAAVVFLYSTIHCLIQGNVQHRRNL